MSSYPSDRPSFRDPQSPRPSSPWALSLPAWGLPCLGTALPGPTPATPHRGSWKSWGRWSVTGHRKNTRSLGEGLGAPFAPVGMVPLEEAADTQGRPGLAVSHRGRMGTWAPTRTISTTPALGRVGQWSGAIWPVPASEPPRPAPLPSGQAWPLGGPRTRQAGLEGRGPETILQQQRVFSSSGLREGKSPPPLQKEVLFL